MIVNKLGYLAEVKVIDGVPHCACCDEPMVEVEPSQWMCQLGATLLTALSDVAAQLDEVVLG